MSVRIARASAQEAARLEADPSSRLGPGEMDTLSRLKHPKRRRDFLAGRLAAKRLAARYLRERGIEPPPPAEISVLNLGDGSPVLRLAEAFGEAPAISISHWRGGGVAAAVEPGGRVGVDVESVEERPASFVEVFAHPDERPGLRSPLDETRLWTLKEAALKLLGLGLSVDLFDVRFSPGLTLHGRARERWESLGRPRIAFSSAEGAREVLSTARTQGGRT
jgi:4'-phosphopantetheinyl transferase